MRFLHAGARQREGGGAPERPGDNQPAIMALRYNERSPAPRGRAQRDISAFALITTVYSDSILLDFTNWNPADETLIVHPVDGSRTDGIHRRLSERNKAIRVVEHLGDENLIPNATHIVGSRGLGLELVSQYDEATADYLPYTPEEAFFLIQALLTEAVEYNIAESAMTYCQAVQLRRGYEQYISRNYGANRNLDGREIVC